MQAWSEFLSQLEQEWGREIVDRWVRPLKVVRFDAANLYLEVEDSFQTAWFEEHVRPRIEKERLTNNNGRPIRIHLCLVGDTKPFPASKEAHRKTPFPSVVSISSDALDSEMTLEHFLPSPKNAMAIRMISQIENISFNPIFLYGPRNVGKTHLLMAAAAVLQRLGKTAFYVRAEKFTEHVVQAIRQGRMQELRKSYRCADALLVDDIHIFARKSATQEEFFHTFNDLHTRGCPILLSSRFAPAQLNEIEPRLVSRFEWGIAIDIESVDHRLILEKKAALWKLSLARDLIPYLLEKFPLSPLHALAALALRSKGIGVIEVQVAEKLLKDLLEENRLTHEKIVKATADHYGILVADLYGKSQMREIVLPRQVAMYICREKLKLSFQKIGVIFKRDHSTVMASIRQIQSGIERKKSNLLEAIAAITIS